MQGAFDAGGVEKDTHGPGPPAHFDEAPTPITATGAYRRMRGMLNARVLIPVSRRRGQDPLRRSFRPLASHAAWLDKLATPGLDCCSTRKFRVGPRILSPGAPPAE